jgi:heptosyltransferase II
MKRALIIRVGAIGDVLMIAPAAKALHDRGYIIDWVCGSVVSPLLAMYPWINRIEIDERALFHGAKLRQLAVTAALWKQLARHRYDICAILHADRRYKLLTLPVRARQRIMLSRHDRKSRFIPGRWLAEEYLRILGITPDGFHEQSTTLLRPERTLLPSLPPTSARARIAIVPGGAKNILRDDSLRRWPLENYAALAQSLLTNGCEVVLTGALDDAWTLPAFDSLLASHPRALLNYIGRTSLPELLALYDSCDAVITHDTGSMHVAGISRAALLAIFGPTDPTWFLPRRPNSKALWGGAHLACRPCYDGRDFADCTYNGCVRDITPAHVLRELDLLLTEARQNSPVATTTRHAPDLA